MFPWKKCFLNVPINEKGIEEHETFDPDMPNVFTVILTDDEYNILFDIFYEWNETFDIIIDIFEEETLEADHTREAMEILDKHINSSSDTVFLAAAAKLKEALSKAVEQGMPLYLDF